MRRMHTVRGIKPEQKDNRVVWILNHYAQEPGGPGGTRHFSLAKHLRKYGWKTCIVASSVEHNTGRQRLRAGESRRLEEHDGVPFLWLKGNGYGGNGPGRIFNILSFAAKALIPHYLSGLEKPDLVIGSSVHPLAAWAGAVLAARHNVPFVLEVRDLWPQTLVDMGRLDPSGFVTKRLYALEKRLYVRAKMIVVLLPRAADYIVPLGIEREKIAWIPNGVDLEDFPRCPFRDREDFVLMYLGAHGDVNGLDNLLRAMAEVKARRAAKRVVLRLIGDGPCKGDLVKLAGQLGLDNVVFEAPVPKSEVPALAADADAFVLCLADLPVYRFGTSLNKLHDYMAGARPVLFCGRSVNNPVKDAGAGIAVDSGAPHDIASAIERLVALPGDVREEMGKRARRYVEDNHSHELLAMKLADVLEQASRGANRARGSTRGGAADEPSTLGPVEGA